MSDSMNPDSLVSASVPTTKPEESKFEKYLVELRNPENRKDLDTFANTFFTFTESTDALMTEDSSLREEVAELQRQVRPEVFHILVDFKLDEDGITDQEERSFYHEAFDLMLKEGAKLSYDKENPLFKEWQEEAYQKVKKYVTEIKKFNAEGYLVKGIELMVTDLLLGDKIDDGKQKEYYENRLNKFEDPIKMLLGIGNKEFWQKFKEIQDSNELVSTPYLNVQGLGFAEKLVKLAQDTGDVAKYRGWANYARNIIGINIPQISLGFDLYRFLKEFIADNPQVKEKLKAIEDKYGINLYLESI